MQHNNVIGKHQATYSFAKNAPPNFWLKDTEKNSFMDSNLENIGNKCFYFFLPLNITLSLTWESLCWFKPVAWVAGTDCSEEVFLFCFAFITPVCRTLVKLQYSIKSTLFAHFSTIVFNEVNIFLLWFFLSFMTHRILIQLKPVNPNVVFQTREENQRFRNRWNKIVERKPATGGRAWNSRRLHHWDLRQETVSLMNHL